MRNYAIAPGPSPEGASMKTLSDWRCERSGASSMTLGNSLCYSSIVGSRIDTKGISFGSALTQRFNTIHYAARGASTMTRSLSTTYTTPSIVSSTLLFVFYKIPAKRD